MKISILLPYKENFSSKYAGAVSLFVKDTTVHSKFKNSINVFGHTKYKSKLLSNYINLDIKKSLLQSNSKIYVKKFLEHENFHSSDLIEVHNRPNYVKFLSKSTSTRLILYFHNDPLTMSGSKSLNERKDLLNKTHKLIFNSKWSRDRFIQGFNKSDIFKDKLIVIYQSSKKVKINFSKKKKIISFVGKLNSAKGYDLFGTAIVKILNKYIKWKAVVIGDEPREKHVFHHKNLKNLGFKPHKFVLNNFNIVSISVVCSRWDEPFGRTSLEASSRGCAVIISNKGGLPETTNHALVLKKLTSDEVYSKIEFLIKNTNKRKLLQRKNYNNFKFTHEYITSLQDHIRSDVLKPSIFFLNKINKNTKFKLLHITNFNERHDGRLHYNTGRRINNGFIRSGHNVLSLSDRDILKQNKSIADLKGKNYLNEKLIKCYENFKPNLIVLGHADNVYNETLERLKNKDKYLKIAQWFLDPVSKMGPDYQRNKDRITKKSYICDFNFLTTSPSALDFNLKNAQFIPNPCDEAFEILSNYNNNCKSDLFFAMSHGVHRGNLKSGKVDDRENFIKKLITMNKNIIFDLYGMDNKQPVWGDQFVNKISNSKMGLNLSRGEPIKHYSSDRIAQLIGNGLLTFIDKKTCYDDFFSNKEMIFYKNLSDLTEKIQKYKKNKKEREKIAMNGKRKYFKYFNSNIVSQYIVNKVFEIKTEKTFWEK
jgi:glycosyltransferase involved in cell wall biosynthesis